MDSRYISNSVAAALLKLAKRYHVTWTVNQNTISGLAPVKDGNRTVLKKLDLCYKVFRKQLLEAIEDMQNSSNSKHQLFAKELLVSEALIKNIPLQMNSAVIADDYLFDIYFNGEVKNYAFPLPLVYMLVWMGLNDKNLKGDRDKHIFAFITQLSGRDFNLGLYKHDILSCLNQLHPDVSLPENLSDELNNYVLKRVYTKIANFLHSPNAKKQELLEKIWLWLDSELGDMNELVVFLGIEVRAIRSEFLNGHGIIADNYLKPLCLLPAFICIPNNKKLSDALYAFSRLILIGKARRACGIQQANHLIQALIEEIKRSKDSLFMAEMQDRVIKISRFSLFYYQVSHHMPLISMPELDSGDAHVDIGGLENRLVKVLAPSYAITLYPWSIYVAGQLFLDQFGAIVWEIITLAGEEKLFIQSLSAIVTSSPLNSSSALLWLTAGLACGHTFLKNNWQNIWNAAQKTAQQSLLIQAFCTSLSDGEGGKVTPLYLLLSTDDGRELFVNTWPAIWQEVKAAEQQSLFIQTLCAITPNKIRGEMSALYHLIDLGQGVPALIDFWPALWEGAKEANQLPMLMQALFHVVQNEGLDVCVYEKETSIFFWLTANALGRELLAKHGSALMVMIKETKEQKSFIQALCYNIKAGPYIGLSALFNVAYDDVGRELLSVQWADIWGMAKETEQLELLVSTLCCVGSDPFDLDRLISPFSVLIDSGHANLLLASNDVDLWSVVEFTNQEHGFVGALCEGSSPHFQAPLSVLAQTAVGERWLVDMLPDIWDAVKHSAATVSLIRGAFLDNPYLMRQLSDGQLGLTSRRKMRISGCLKEIQNLEVAIVDCDNSHDLLLVKAVFLGKLERLIQKQEWSDFTNSSHYNFFAPPSCIKNLVKLISARPKALEQYFQKVSDIINEVDDDEFDNLSFVIKVIYQLLRVQLREILSINTALTLNAVRGCD